MDINNPASKGKRRLVVKRSSSTTPKRFTGKVIKKAALACTLTALLTSSMITIPVMAQSFNQNQGWSGTRPLENDFHTNTWDRFQPNYNFHTGPDFGFQFGSPTQTDQTSRPQQNQRVDSGAAFNPPPAGLFSGAFPTEHNNQFAIQTPIDNQAWNTTNFANSNTQGMGFGGSNSNMGGGQMLPSTSILSNGGGNNQGSQAVHLPEVQNPSNNQNNNIAGSTVTVTELPPVMQSHQPNPELNHTPAPLPGSNTSALITAPRFFEDGSLGRLSIPRINLLNQAVFSGVGYNIIDHHIGHFPTTSAWDGNVGLAAHNGGRAGFFQRLPELHIGDEIIFETPHGTRTYVVVSSHVINETDFSLLGWSHENTITLVTCNRGGLRTDRFVVVAAQR